MSNTGWEIDDLTSAISDEYQGKSNELTALSNSYPLSAINAEKDHFIVIRKFSARVFEGKIDMLNQSYLKASEHYPIAHFGMTLVSYSDDCSSSSNVIFPNSLTYEKVALKGDTITIFHSEGTTVTNFEELNSLWTFDNLSTQEILDQFNGLSNKRREVQPIKKITKKSLKDSFFGQLSLDKDLDSFITEHLFKDRKIELSFSNTTAEQMTSNLRRTEVLLTQLQEIEEAMIEEMLSLKNENWLDEGEAELTKSAFQKEVSIYGINIYEEGDTEIYYKANDLFWGHEIQVSLDDDNKYESSTLVG